MKPKQRYGILYYHSLIDFYNIGDYIQRIASSNFLPHIDEYVIRESIDSPIQYPLKLIVNGWFTHTPMHWPPHQNINPLFISFHLNEDAIKILDSEENINYFRSHAPIGCRDITTLRNFENVGIPCYLSSCLTLTLNQKIQETQQSNEILFVDVLYKTSGWRDVMFSRNKIRKILSLIKQGRMYQREKILFKFFSKRILFKAKYLTHNSRAFDSDHERMEEAELLLQRYANAKLVVTSRLHCALPCLAFGTPVIFISKNLNTKRDMCRLEGMMDLFNYISLDEKNEIESNFFENKIDLESIPSNPNTYLKFVDSLINNVQFFINKI